MRVRLPCLPVLIVSKRPPSGKSASARHPFGTQTSTLIRYNLQIHKVIETICPFVPINRKNAAALVSTDFAEGCSPEQGAGCSAGDGSAAVPPSLSESPDQDRIHG